MKQWICFNWLKLVAIVMLVGAFLQLDFLPYAFYQLMTWAVLGASVTLAWQAYKQNMEWLAWVFVVVAVVFNPFAPLHLRADVWQIADLVVAGMFAVSFVILKPQSRS